MARNVNPLFRPLQLGNIGMLEHRVALAPLTRLRADEPNLAPRAMNVEYYRQRASPGGLLISEATYISPESHGYAHAPGIWTEDQVRQWKLVTDAVHGRGGLITCQLWHIGRVAHTDWKLHPLISAYGPLYRPGVSASALAIPGKMMPTPDGTRKPAAVPRALETAEIPRLVADYVHAAKCAQRAGFDGVEIHAAHGYLIDQFLNAGSNQRTDEYGGSIENRCRLLFEVVDAVTAAFGAGKVAVRLSPHPEGTKAYSGCTDPNQDALFTHAIRGLDRKGLAYLLLTEPRWDSSNDNLVELDPGFVLPAMNSIRFRREYTGTLIAAGGFTPKTAQDALNEGLCDAIAFGRWFISNPDLPARLKDGTPLNRYERASFYGYSDAGYTDYPTSAEVALGKAAGYTQVDQAAIGASLAAAKL